MKDNQRDIYDYIVVGQGVAGTLISWNLRQRGLSHIVIDNDHHQAASKIAAGVINPITGRKYVKSWRIEEFLPVARETYQQLSEYLGLKVGHDRDIYRGLYSIQDENTWEARRSDPVAGQFIADTPLHTAYDGLVNGVFSYGVLRGGMQVPLGVLISAYRASLERDGMMVNEKFVYEDVHLKDKMVCYGDITAKRIIFAEGYQAQYNPWFGYLPWEPAKGDVLIIKIDGRPFDQILRHKVFISPIDAEHYWVGSGYRWQFEDDAPDEVKGREIRETLDKILNVPYEIVRHIAGIRPCVKGRRPFLGRHATHEQLILFNGLGTKGASLGPFWARHLISHLEEGTPLDSEVRI